MRFAYGWIALMLWLYFLSLIAPDVSGEAILISGAIVAAGAMAGGK